MTTGDAKPPLIIRSPTFSFLAVMDSVAPSELWHLETSPAWFILNGHVEWPTDTSTGAFHLHLLLHRLQGLVVHHVPQLHRGDGDRRLTAAAVLQPQTLI